MAHVIDGDGARDDRQEFLQYRRIDAALLRCLSRDIPAGVFRTEDVPENLIADAATDQAAENSASPGSGAHKSAASKTSTEKPTEHPAKSATFGRLNIARIRRRKPLRLNAIGDMRDESACALLNRRFIDTELPCNRARATSLIKQ